MKNNQQFKDWIKTTQNVKASQALHDQIDAMTHPHRFKHILKLSVGTLGVLTLGFLLLVNVSKSFYIFALDTPLKEIALAFRFIDDTVQQAIDANKYQPINTTLHHEGKKLLIETMIVDSNTIIFKTDRSNLLGVDIVVTDAQNKNPSTLIFGEATDSNLTILSFDRDIVDKDIIHITQPNATTLSIEVDGSKKVTPQQIELNQTIHEPSGTITLESFTFGGIKSQLMVHVEPIESMKLVTMKVRLITTSGEIINSPTSSTYNDAHQVTVHFDTGSILDTGIESVELIYSSFINIDHETIIYDPKTDAFSFLPNEVNYLGQEISESNVIFRFEKISLSEYDFSNFLSPNGLSYTGFPVLQEEYQIVLDEQEYQAVISEHSVIEFTNSIPDVRSFEVYRFTLNTD